MRIRRGVAGKDLDPLGRGVAARTERPDLIRVLRFLNVLDVLADEAPAASGDPGLSHPAGDPCLTA